jgi:hypothetical protein
MKQFGENLSRRPRSRENASRSAGIRTRRFTSAGTGAVRSVRRQCREREGRLPGVRHHVTVLT